MDTDGDEVLTLSELDAYGRVSRRKCAWVESNRAEIFRATDANRDGIIDREEFVETAVKK